MILGQYDCYVGGYARAKMGTHEANSPIDRGIVTNWDDMVKIWHHTFYDQLRVAPEDQTVLLAYPPLSPKADREKITQIMFEMFHTPALHLASQANLSLYAAGRTTGIVLESGKEVSHIVPIWDGFASHTAVQLNFGGDDLTNYLIRLLKTRGHFINTAAERAAVREAKERFCYVAQDFEQELRTPTASPNSPLLERSFWLPNGQVKISDELFKCPEALFQPSLMGIECDGIHNVIHKAISLCDVRLRPEYYGNVVLREPPGFQASPIVCAKSW